MLSQTEILELGKGISAEDYQILDKYARRAKSNKIIEIGSRFGTSTMLLGNVVMENGGTLYCIECEPTQKWRDNIEKAGIKEHVNLIHTISPWVNYADLPSKIDFLFIDGDHRTSYAIADYHFFSPLVKVGGYIAFHDTHFRDATNVSSTVNRAIDIILEDHKNVVLEDEALGDFGVKILKKTGEWN